MIAIDTNLLIYAHRAGLPQHRAAQRALAKARNDPRGWGIALSSVAEFWSVVTHPASAGGPSTPQQAHDFLVALVEAEAAVWLPGENFGESLARVAADLKVQGLRIFDLQIALTALENGASEIWTHDARFLMVPGLRVHRGAGRLGQPMPCPNGHQPRGRTCSTRNFWLKWPGRFLPGRRKSRPLSAKRGSRPPQNKA